MAGKSDGTTIARCATGSSQSSSTECSDETCAPFFAACRNRCATSGWSLRRKLPTTSARSTRPRSAIGMPRNGAPARWPSSRKSAWRSRKSTLSLPRPRTRRAASAISSSVECGDTSAPTAVGPCRWTTSARPFATYSSAVGQSTVFHSPPCFSIGCVRRSGVLSASYEKRSLSEIQHSLTASFSRGSTRITRSFLTCTTRLLPRPSCGDTLLRRASSHVRAA